MSILMEKLGIMITGTWKRTLGALAAAALLAGGLAGCNGQGNGLVITRADATALTGVWQGEYSCAQGVTGLKLTTAGQSDGSVSALFEFYPVARNPKVPRGSFTVRGSFNSAGQLQLQPERWIVSVAGWNMVGLNGKVQNGQFSGTVPQCQNQPFAVVKTSNSTAPVAAAAPTPAPAAAEAPATLPADPFLAPFKRAQEKCQKVDSLSSKYASCLQKNGYDVFKQTRQAVTLSLIGGGAITVPSPRGKPLLYQSYDEQHFHVVGYDNHADKNSDATYLTINTYVDAYTGKQFPAPEGGYHPNPARTLMVDVSSNGEETENMITLYDMKTGKSAFSYKPRQEQYVGEFTGVRWHDNDSFELIVECKSKNTPYLVRQANGKWQVPKMRPC